MIDSNIVWWPAARRARVINWLIAIALVPSLAGTGARADARVDDAPVTRRWASPQPTGETLNAIWGTATGAWAVGDAGTILRSTDHGGSWTAVDSGTTQDLRAIWGSSGDDLWIAGEGGTVLRSTDGGVAWQRQTVPTSGSLQAIWGSERHDIYFAGGGGQLLHTRDHGRTFATLRPLGDADEQLTAVWGGPLDASGEVVSDVPGHVDGHVAGGVGHVAGAVGHDVADGASAAYDLYVAGDRGSLLSSVDHGEHWVPLRQPSPRPVSAVGNATATTGGVKTPRGGGAVAGALSGALSIEGTGRGDFVSVFGAWGLARDGGAGGTAAEHTRDGGRTWSAIHVDPSPAPSPGYRAFHAADGRAVYGVAAFEFWDRPVEDRQRLGLIVSRDGGAGFERRSLLPRGASVNALWRDPTGPLIAIGPLGTILRSRDQGRTWEEGRAAHPFGTATLRALWSDGGQEVWAVGDACTVLHSSDGGAQFELQRPCPPGAGTDLESVWGGDADSVYVAGALVLRTVDRGQHWAAITPPAPVAASWRIWGSGAGDLYAAGYGVWRSTDAAQSWRLVNGSRSRSRADWFGHLFGAGNDRYAVTQLGRLERGSKTGASWQSVAPPTSIAGCCGYWADGDAGLYAFGAIPAGATAPGTGAGGVSSALFRSRDAGRSFQPLTTSLGGRPTFIALHRRGQELFLLSDNPSAMAAATAAPAAATMPTASSQQTTLLRSSDDGATWATYALLPAGCTALTTVGKDLLVVGANGLVVRLH